VSNLESLVREILSRLSKLEKDVQDLRGENVSLSQDDKPKFHTLSALEHLEKEKMRKKKKMEPLLDNAAEMAILHFKREPPERRVI